MPQLVNLANGLQREESAVQNVLISPYNTGWVEGQIAKLKLLKRQSYGPAKLDLLRQRTVGAA
jgi:transposase